MDEQVEEIYRQVADQITPEDFQARVEEKVALMAGLCDGRTAAMLVARDLGASEVLTKIGSIRPETGNVTFMGKVLSVSEIREFPRSDGSMGRVANLTLADETGSVRLALWDETVELVRSGDLKEGQCLKVRGLAKEGKAGTEVSLVKSGGSGIEEVDLDILPRTEPYKIAEIKSDMSGISLLGIVVDPGEIREFQRKDKGKGQVRTVLLGDETGKIRLTLWNEQAAMALEMGETIEVINGSSRERYGSLEIQTGSYSKVLKSSKKVQFSEKMPRIEPYKIAEIKSDMSEISLLGVVVDPGEIREFQRKDKGKGQVRTVLLGDETGKIRLTLWNEQAAMALEMGETIEVINGSSRERYGSLEIQTGSYSKVLKSSKKVQFSEKMTPIAELKPGMICSVSGFVTGLGEVREFQRDDGKAGRVANIYISDETGRIKVALWAEHVDLLRGLDLGYKAELIDAQAKNGWDEGLELSCGQRTRITFAPPG